MIKSITITNYLGESIKMELCYPEKSGFAVLHISGLGPAKATINSTELSTADGSIYNSARVNARNIVLLVKLLELPTVEVSRQRLYKYFPIKKPITFRIETDTRTCEAYGYVEANEPDIFSNNETAQVSIICPDPYFYSSGKNGTTVTIFSGVTPEFEFPFMNDSLTEDLIVFGEVIPNQEKAIYYTGDAEVGVIINIHAIGEATNVAIYNSLAHEVMKIDTVRLTQLTGSGIMAGDDIIISTIKGKKYVRLFRDGAYTNILNCLDKDADWFQLVKGDNIFAFDADTGSNNIQLRIENQTVYEGV